MIEIDKENENKIIAVYIGREILITSLSPLFSAIYDHIRVEGNAINWTSIRAIIIELVSNPKFKANVDASAITVWTPSINRKKAIKNIKTFLYSGMDFKVEKIFPRDLLNTFFEDWISLSL